MFVEYSSNNSGGSWWLQDRDWDALAEAGWHVVPPGHYVDFESLDGDGVPLIKESGGGMFASMISEDDEGVVRYMGAKATCAFVVGKSLREAVENWEEVTGMSADEPGCHCCGNPHGFTEYDDAGEYVRSGPDFLSVARWDDDEEEEGGYDDWMSMDPTED